MTPAARIDQGAHESTSSTAKCGPLQSDLYGHKFGPVRGSPYCRIDFNAKTDARLNSKTADRRGPTLMMDVPASPSACSHLESNAPQPLRRQHPARRYACTR